MSSSLSMLGAFRSSLVCQGGLLWKIPWRLSPTRKANVRARLKIVHRNIDIVSQIPVKSLVHHKKYDNPKDKYFTDVAITPMNHEGKKGIHKTPHFTKLPREHERLRN